MAIVDPRFAEDVRIGLGGDPKSLPCVYFYDKRGSHLFERICGQPEYYPTEAERRILRRRADDIAESSPDPVQVVELGSGSSSKTLLLLEALLEARERVIYHPVDVSRNILNESASMLDERYPRLEVRPIVARYEEGLKTMNAGDGGILLLWLGSSIGNLERGQAITFLAELREQLSAGDLMLIGIDLVKAPDVLEAAYNDLAGVTADFNLNLLARINRELGGQFDLDEFRHVAVYNEDEGRIEMYLESRRNQMVSIEALDMVVSLEAGERIHTENSHKYRRSDIETLADGAGLRTLNQWLDSDGMFSLNLFGLNGSRGGP